MAIGATAANVLAYETQEDYGRNALVYQIISPENIEIYADTSEPATDSKVYSYLDNSGRLSSETSVGFAPLSEELYQQQWEEAQGLAENTLQKPQIINTQEGNTRSIKEYVIQSGDTFGGIANRFNISINTILWANNLTLRSMIKPGQKLIILPLSGTLHKIVRNDTIAKIAKTYQADASKIKDYNRIDGDDKLVVGEFLIVPEGKIIYTPKPTPKPVTPPKTTVVKTYPVPEPVYDTSGKMGWPADCRRISQYFRGWRHTGLDTACTFGSPIYAVADGVVEKVQYGRTGYGYYVIINHGDGVKTLYGHASRILVAVGQYVSRGEVIMEEGSTGKSTGPHLHFEVRINGSQLNPLNYIK